MLVYLASTSPRRHDLLARAGIDFVAVLPGPEPAGDGAPVQLARQRARSKLSGAQLPPAAAPGLVLAVDTVVDVDGCELGKPGDRAQARHMLRQLAGREHLVHTAHCARLHPARSGGRCELLATARVRVRPLGLAEVE